MRMGVVIVGIFKTTYHLCIAILMNWVIHQA